MPLITFACPACQKVLKSATPIAAGTRAKCPTCGASFVMGAQGAAPTGPPSANGDVPASRAAGGSRRLRVLLIAAPLLVAALGIGAYVLFRGGGDVPGREKDPLAFVPPGAEFVAGADFPLLLDDPLLGPSIETALREQARAGDLLDRCQKETGLSTRELLGHAILAGRLATLEAALPPAIPLGLPGRPAGAGGAPPPAPMILVLKTARPFDPEQVVRAAESASPKRVHGKTYYEVSAGGLRTLYMPSDRIIVLSALPASELDPVFRSDGVTPNLSPDTLALVRSVESHPTWAVVPVEGATRSRLEGAAPKGRSLTDSLAKAKGITVWGAPDGERLKVGADIACADAAAAAQTTAAAQAAWKKQRSELVQATLVLRFMVPKTVAALDDLTNSVTFTTDGATTRLTAGVSRPAIADASAELEQRQQTGGLRGGFPGFGPKPGAGAGKKR